MAGDDIKEKAKPRRKPNYKNMIVAILATTLILENLFLAIILAIYLKR